MAGLCSDCFRVCETVETEVSRNYEEYARKGAADIFALAKVAQLQLCGVFAATDAGLANCIGQSLLWLWA